MEKQNLIFDTVDLELPETTHPLAGETTDDMTDPRHILGEAPPPRRQGELIGKLAQSRTYVRQEEGIDELAAAMDKAVMLHAVGVVNDTVAPVGIILRRELFEHLGKRYGRELYKRKPLSLVMKPARLFRDDLNIFIVASMLADELRMLDDTFCLLVDAQGRYSGVFSTRNLLIYLSETTGRDIALARRLQAAIVRESDHFGDTRCSVLCYSKMAKEVGGDFYLVKRLTPDRLLACVCDVSGKGIAASLITAVLGGVFDTYTGGRGLGPFLQGLNRYIFETFRLEYFVTGIFLELDCRTGEAVICDMGHSYFLVAQGRNLYHLGKKSANPPLGVVPDLAPELSLHRFPPGGRAVLFTDGIVEQTDRTGSEFSERRLWSLLKENAEEDLLVIRDRLCAALDDFRGEEPQNDDLTFLLLKFN